MLFTFLVYFTSITEEKRLVKFHLLLIAVFEGKWMYCASYSFPEKGRYVGQRQIRETENCMEKRHSLASGVT